MKTIRIGCGQGFWGDSLEAPLDLIRGGPIDYLVLDYLAEVTMSILARQKQKHPEAGYARDFVELMERALPEIVQKNIRVIANAGGVNAEGCARAVAAVAKKHGLTAKVRIAIVQGDDICGDLPRLQSKEDTFSHLETGESFDAVRERLQSANIYFGAEMPATALAHGANIVITGRVSDPALVLAPLVHEFGWKWDDWDKLAAGIVAGHIVECGAQCTGGNCSYEWESIPDLAGIGYPIVEFHDDGSFVVTKHPGTGGRIDLRTVKEQLIYEIGDPTRYITPDVVADFTSVRLEDLGNNAVKVSGVKGTVRPERLKVSMSYSDGYVVSGTMIYSWPDAYRKARAAGEIIKSRLAKAGVSYEKIHCEAIGVNACHGPITDQDMPDIPEVMFRIAMKTKDKASAERFTREIAPLVLNGPPSATAYFASRGSVQEVFAYWPTLIGRSAVEPRLTFLEDGK